MTSNCYSPTKPKNETIKVCIRMRPLLQHEDVEFWSPDPYQNTISTINLTKKDQDNSKSEWNSILSNKEKEIKRVMMDSIYSPQNFHFDKIYSNDVNSQLIYKEMCRDITKSVIHGYNGTIFMYGQTTSGKTFTMLGSPTSPGVLPCALRDIFNLISREEDPSGFSVACSYIEIYNENIHDLLTDANNLKLIDDTKQGVIVSGAKRVKIKCFEDGITLKDYGEENRKYRETLINEYSSRSHSIFQVFVEYENSSSSEKVRYSSLNLVDLAGSERLNDYDTKTEAFGETGYINKSLFVLANVVNKLAQDKATYVPFRDSKLTRLLSQSLGGNARTLVICTVSPAALNYYQTLSTLRFATRAKLVKTKAHLNEYMDDKATIEYYKNEVKKLQDELNKYEKQFEKINLEGSQSNTGINSNTNPKQREKEFIKSAINEYSENKKRNNPVGNINIPAIENYYQNSNQINGEHSSEKNCNSIEPYSNASTKKQNKNIMEHFVKSNESLSNEADNYKEMYLYEKEKNDRFRCEISKIKSLGILPVNPQNMQNKESASKAQVNKHKEAYNSHNSQNLHFSIRDRKLYSEDDENNSPSSLFNKNKNERDNLFLEGMLNKLCPHFEKNKNYRLWRDDMENINHDFIAEVKNLNCKYKDIIKETSYKNFSFLINSSPELIEVLRNAQNINLRPLRK